MLTDMIICRYVITPRKQDAPVFVSDAAERGLDGEEHHGQHPIDDLAVLVGEPGTHQGDHEQGPLSQNDSGLHTPRGTLKCK